MKKKIKVAVIFDQKLKSGGGYQQAINASVLISKINLKFSEITFYSLFKKNINILEQKNIKVNFLKINIFEKFLIFLKTSPRFELIHQLMKIFVPINIFENKLRKENIDLVYFVSPSRLALELKNINFIFTIWDLCHRDNPEFPEVKKDNQFQLRENIYNQVLPRASAVIVDSQAGKKNLVKRYLIDQERVYVIPFEPSMSIRDFSGELSNKVFELIQYNLNCPYLFYPAQYWPHKNHVYILEGIKQLESIFSQKINAIFTGSDKGNLDYIKKYAANLGLSERIYFLDFVSDQEIIDLYKSSLALVMPSYFGPTNLPPLEAFCLGVPVLYPDLYGMREQVSGAGLLINLAEPSSMAIQINKLIKYPSIREDLIKAGKKIYSENSQGKRELILEKILKNFYFRRKCWE